MDPQTSSLGINHCPFCYDLHEKRIFISHAKEDKELVERIGKACCEVGVRPYLFEFTQASFEKRNPAKAITCELRKSDAVIVLLSQSVSQAYWTQAWIGFEIGFAKGIAAPDLESKRVVVLADIKGKVDASIPMLDAYFLFDFSSFRGWDVFKDLAKFLTDEKGVFKFGNRVREAIIRKKIRCNNCQSQYEAWIAKRDTAKLGVDKSSMNEYTIKCASCDKPVRRVFKGWP